MDLRDDRSPSEPRRRLSLLQDIRIASPCNASWDTMTGDDRVRFCGECQKNVYNLSAMARDEAERLVEEREGSLCVRFYQREDGTVLTADCPVGARRRLVRRTAFAMVAAGLVATGAALAALAPDEREPVREVSVTPQATVASPPPRVEPPAAVTGGISAPPPQPIRPRMGRPAAPQTPRPKMGAPTMGMW